MTVYFTADHHFGHGGAMGLFKRPYASTAAMDEAMIERWNAVVTPDDIVWYLGDFSLHKNPDHTAWLLAILQGRKYLIAGNNDPANIRDLQGWTEVAEYRELELDGCFLVLCHYPLRSWNKQHRKSWQLHGHSHGRLKPLTRQVDVGVDCWDFAPITLSDIQSRRSSRSSLRAAKATQAP